MWVSVHSRGLDSLKAILDHIGSGELSVAYPDFMCDEVVDVLGERFWKRLHYHIEDNLRGVPVAADVLYLAHYFGETASYVPGIPCEYKWVIHDAVWQPRPMKPPGPNEFWYNSARKCDWPNRGSALVTDFKLGEGEEYPSLSWPEATKARFANFDAGAKVLKKWLVGGSFGTAQFYPSVIPLLVPSRALVVKRLADDGITLPGMWKNTYRLPSTLYNRMLLVPCDQRFSVEQMIERADLVAAAIVAG